VPTSAIRHPDEGLVARELSGCKHAVVAAANILMRDMLLASVVGFVYCESELYGCSHVCIDCWQLANRFLLDAYRPSIEELA